jgi:NADH-quinone oxidoreductase subunit M
MAGIMPAMMWLAVAGIIYGALVALAQTDIKRLIAYSSVSHLGFCMLGLFALNATGVQGSVLQMVNHGLSTGALFALVGMLYERYHTRQIADLSGLAVRMPWLAFFMVLFTFSSIGVPGLNGFAGEFLILLGAFQRAWADSPPLVATQLLTIAVLAVSGVVLGAWYMLWLLQRVFFGPLQEPHPQRHHAARDLTLREIVALAPLAIFVVWIGIRPIDFLSRMQPTLDLARSPAAAELDRLAKQTKMSNVESQMTKETRMTKSE